MAFILSAIFRIVGLIGLAGLFQWAMIFAEQEVYELKGVGPTGFSIIIALVAFLSFMYLIPRFSRRFVEGSPSFIVGTANSIFVTFTIIGLFTAYALGSDIISDIVTQEHAVGLINIGVLVGFITGLMVSVRSITYKIRHEKSAKTSKSPEARRTDAAAKEQTLRDLRQQRMQR